MMKRSRSGFTLVEIILSAGMVGLVALTFFTVYTMAQRYLLQSTLFTIGDSEATYALEHMKHKLTRANRVLIFPSPTTATDGNIIAFRYDHRTDPAATPNDVNDDQWDCYILDTGTNELKYKKDYKSGPVSGGGDPDEPTLAGTEVIVGNILAPGGSVPNIFQLIGGQATVRITLTIHPPSSQFGKDTTVVYEVSPRGVGKVG